MADPQIMIEGDLAVAFGLSPDIKTDGTKVDSWSRQTIVLRRTAGSWKIIHEHASFPWQWTEVAGCYGSLAVVLECLTRSKGCRFHAAKVRR
ncbi:nuclear transport factor 2 family protein [Mesorhizobium abyssinicae]|uniref:nuclear transport factor 2 family protein n=1 Tax=Mesorhizobium abyssinicae TaxID=1209958 RepID=UPI002A24E229|nr:nuclear transport factor 2 family protein [Mesorhizobium abyssinicae]